METGARAHKQTTAQATIQEVLHQSVVSRQGRHVLEDASGGWIQTAWKNKGSLPKKVTKEANQQGVSV